VHRQNPKVTKALMVRMAAMVSAGGKSDLNWGIVLAYRLLEALMASIFHLAEAKRWQAVMSRRQLYYPPTFDQDGLTHTAPTVEALVTVVNQFYQQLAGPWLVLMMDPEHLIDLGVDLRVEAASEVGDQGHHYLGSEEVLFPHIYGGISAEMVLREDPMPQAASGQFEAPDLKLV